MTVPDTLQPFEQPPRLRAVAPVSGRDREADRQPHGIESGMDFRGQAVSGPPDGASVKPPF